MESFNKFCQKNPDLPDNASFCKEKAFRDFGTESAEFESCLEDFPPRWTYWMCLNDALDQAIRNKNMEKVHQYTEQGADIDGALSEAARTNSREIVDYLISKGATDIESGLRGAWSSKSTSMTKFLIEIVIMKQLKFSYNEPLATAIDTEDCDLLLLIMQKVNTSTESMYRYLSYKGKKEFAEKFAAHCKKNDI